MKYKVNYDASLEQDDLIINCHPDNQNIEEMIQLIQTHADQTFYPVKNRRDETHIVKQNDIYSFRIENKLLNIYTLNGQYIYNERLYKLKKHLSDNFLQISKSEIINVTFIDHLVLNKSGIIEIKFINNDTTFSSRRYLKEIKEVLGL
ncbi:LytTR family DNA-binding domain-containing protein [Mammaliicoccus sp. G-M28]|uniref:LytTR family DNA-binding domain-containing protein n=1 Tax=Mammaliicoccus sp. G-M28 TaxID=2898688 RepID=UPI001EFA51E9|nr:LytTR family DNA-binding domain-containing protein [Mammaliicoccus sp. G-M28]